jgi:hypothetical protein
MLSQLFIVFFFVVVVLWLSSAFPNLLLRMVAFFKEFPPPSLI